MSLIIAFLRLVRWQNLFFIAVTQLLFMFCIIHPIFLRLGLVHALTPNHFIELMVASIVIAAGGNTINDYFDLNIDEINKPSSMVVGKHINRRWVIFWHLLLSSIGIVLSVHVGFSTDRDWIGYANIGCVLLLFIYSASLKKRFLIGNILVSLLTAWVILILTAAEFKPFAHLGMPEFIANEKIFKLGVLFGGFAFIISLIREVIKDMEDIIGDRKYNCKTMPIVWGINATKVFVAVWFVVIIVALCIIAAFVLNLGWWLSAIYCIGAVVFPLIWVFKDLFGANSTKDFHQLSTYIKYIMLTGIISMVFYILH